MSALFCWTCGAQVQPLKTWNGAHLEAKCPGCKRHLKFLPQTPVWLDGAPPRPPPPKPEPDLFSGLA